MIIETITDITNSYDLQRALAKLTTTPEPGDTYVLSAITGQPIKLQLRENRLSDESVTYDILIG